MSEQTTTITLDDAIKALAFFMPAAELRCMTDGLKGEEADFFRDKLLEYGERVTTMPVTYETDDFGKATVAHLHYFHGGCDWYIVEADVGDGTDDKRQHQAFGHANLGDRQNAEFGYISIAELIECGVQLDLHFEPKTVGELGLL